MTFHGWRSIRPALHGHRERRGEELEHSGPAADLLPARCRFCEPLIRILQQSLESKHALFGTQINLYEEASLRETSTVHRSGSSARVHSTSTVLSIHAPKQTRVLARRRRR